MRAFWGSKINSEVMFFNLLYIRWCKRAGVSWIFFEPTCQFVIGHPDCPHVRGWYFHIGWYGGDIAWNSKICYEASEKGYVDDFKTNIL